MNSVNTRLEDYFKKFEQIAKSEFASEIVEIKCEFIKKKSLKCNEYKISFLLSQTEYSFPVWYSADKGITYNIKQGNKQEKQCILKRIIEKVDEYFCNNELKTSSHTFCAEKSLFDEIQSDFSSDPYKIEHTPQENRIKIILDDILQLSVSYYDTKHLLIQGKTTYLWDKVFFYISEKLNLSGSEIVEKYIKSISEFNKTKIEISSDVLDFKLKNSIGADLFKNDKKMLLHSEFELLRASEQFLSLNISSLEYSFMLQPAFRVVEGLLRRIIHNKNLIDSNKEPSRQFYQFHNDKNQLDVQYHQKLNNDNIAIEKINKLYEIYNRERCVYAHSDGINPAIITDEEIAISIYNEICTLLKEIYPIYEKFI